MSDLGKELIRIRKEKGFSIREVSKRSGVSHPYISQLETGKNKNPSPDILVKIAKALKLEPSEVIYLAGYDELYDVVKYGEALKDFSSWDDKYTIEYLKDLKQNVELLDHVTDLKTFLKDDFVHEDTNDEEAKTAISPTYNGHTLTREDREKISGLIEITFPQYKDPYNYLKK